METWCKTTPKKKTSMKDFFLEIFKENFVMEIVLWVFFARRNGKRDLQGLGGGKRSESGIFGEGDGAKGICAGMDGRGLVDLMVGRLVDWKWAGFEEGWCVVLGDGFGGGLDSGRCAW